jgi:hypothetical protein
MNFNKITQCGYTGLCIREKDHVIAEGFFGEVLRSIPHLADRAIREQRAYFDVWVIELESEEASQ